MQSALINNQQRTLFVPVAMSEVAHATADTQRFATQICETPRSTSAFATVAKGVKFGLPMVADRLHSWYQS
jgi:hypothetical protein